MNAYQIILSIIVIAFIIYRWNHVINIYRKESLEKQKNLVEIKKGQNWYLKSQMENPFNREDYKVKIKDCKEGWVNYTMGMVFNNESIEEKSFRMLYQLKEETKDEENINIANHNTNIMPNNNRG